MKKNYIPWDLILISHYWHANLEYSMKILDVMNLIITFDHFKHVTSCKTKIENILFLKAHTFYFIIKLKDCVFEYLYTLSFQHGWRQCRWHSLKLWSTFFVVYITWSSRRCKFVSTLYLLYTLGVHTEKLDGGMCTEKFNNLTLLWSIH